jgi:hypothetical protein
MTISEEFETGFYGCWYEPDDCLWQWYVQVSQDSHTGWAEQLDVAERAASKTLAAMKAEQ